MPTVLRAGPYRLFFFSNEGTEPPPVHVESGDCHAKFWIGPTRLAATRGYRSHELAEIRRIIEANEGLIEERWNEFFADA